MNAAAGLWRAGSAFCIGRTRWTSKQGSELNPKKISGYQVLRSCRPSRLLCRLSTRSCDMPAERQDDRLKVLLLTDRRGGQSSHLSVRERIGAMSRLVRASGLRTLVSPFHWNQHIGQE